MERFLGTWFASSVALSLAALVLGSHMVIGDAGTGLVNRVLEVAIVGLVFTFVHEAIGVVLKLLSLPFIIVTLGLFLLVINAILLLLTAWLTGLLGVHFHVAGFWWAVLGSIVVSICQSLVSSLVGDGDRS